MRSNTDFDLEHAIEDKSLALFYQPRISSVSQEIVGVEALLRSKNKKGEWLTVPSIEAFSPDEFDRLWGWELAQVEQVFLLLRKFGWDPEIQKFFIALNLSSKQLHTELWADKLLGAIDRAGIPGGCVEVELTETGNVFQDVECAIKAFAKIKQVGVVLALDDFPMGSDSFARLAHFKFDKVKVDRSLLPTSQESILVRSRRKTLIRELVSMIRGVGADAVLEGIETDQHREFAHDLQLVEWQGYYWGGAMEFEKILSSFPCVSKATLNNQCIVRREIIN